MSQKELLYVEDSYNHEKVLISCINEIINNLSDEDLIDYMTSELKNHENNKKEIMKVLEEFDNE